MLAGCCCLTRCALGPFLNNFHFLKLTNNYIFAYRYHKNKREQKPGWNREIVEWCKQAAEDKNLKDCDYWGGFVIDEMKVEVSRLIYMVMVNSDLQSI